jgi:cytochrome c556
MSALLPPRRLGFRPRVRPLLVAALLAAAGTAAVVAQPKPADRQALVAQKARLVEQLLGSAKVQAAQASGDAAVQAALERARSLLRDAAQDSDTAQAELRVNEALRLTSQVTRPQDNARAAAAAAAAPGAATRQSELREQVTEYRRAIVSAVQARGAAAGNAGSTLASLDSHLAEAQRHQDSGRSAEATVALEQAYRVAVETLSALRAGETVAIELKFNTPADEYAYELKRYQGHETLLTQTLAEQPLPGAARSAVNQRADEARALQARAADSAARGDHAGGVKLLEDAVKQLFRALQAAGMPGLY